MLAVLIAGCSASESSWRPQSKTDEKSAEPAGQKTPPITAVEKSKTKSVPVVRPKRKAVLPQPHSNLVTDFRLTERSGKTVTRADLIGKPWVACFVFTNCTIFCGKVSGAMAGLQRWMRANGVDDVKIVTFTVDPENDTPQRLADYAEIYSADKNRWWFLTGDKKTIYGLIRGPFRDTVYENVGEARKPGYEVVHTDAVALVDANGKVVRKFHANDVYSMGLLRSRLRTWKRHGRFRLPVEAAKPKREAKR